MWRIDLYISYYYLVVMKWSFYVALLLSLITGMLIAALFYEMPLANAAPEQLSPSSRVTEEQVLVFSDHIRIQVKNAQWATFTDTNSMDPLIDAGANALQVIPDHPDEIHVGDVITYARGDQRIIHRVVYIGQDTVGWYCIVKGDNNKIADPGKIRFEQIDRVLFGILY